MNNQESSITNVWGTLKSDIDSNEFCVECEHSVSGHYTNCPLYRASVSFYADGE